MTWLRTLPWVLSTTPRVVIIWPKSYHDTGRFTYRCFLPDLTEFVTSCCVAPDRVPHKARVTVDPKKGIQPRVSGFRVTGHR
jgi:hypothetical protein